ncbi:YitT family protein [Paenibacillus thalictri]|uniref:YitT family protein n=1 Tax=Paenibacillus thalictri TaxID=2527873 RepID=A0A4Q9E165_9BACL|nr:YitT family protein [Paenibacillus thalictri]TBL81301.1 YitT family protein [Paenibacillus thalictri]
MMKALSRLFVTAIGALLVTVGFNFFLVPHSLLSGGLSGIALIISYFTGWNVGLLYLISNIPVMILGLLRVGRTFIILSTVSVVLTSWMLQFVPVITLTHDKILTAISGGVLIGLGSGISLRAGGSTGGFDVIGSILTRNRDFPLGSALFALNGVVILALGYFKNDWDLALGSIFSIFITVKVIDAIHIRHLKVTVFIITCRKDQLLERMLSIQRGVTAIQTEGAYTKQGHHMLMTVTTKYELGELKELIREADPGAFVNIVETAGVMGLFRREG